MFPYTTTVFVFSVLCIIVIFLLSNIGMEQFREALATNDPNLNFKMPPFLFLLYLLYASQTGGVDWKMAGWAFVYLSLPVLLIPRAEAGNKITICDALAILCLWVPFDLHLLGRRAHAIKDALDYPLLAISAIILCLICWVGERRLEGTKACFASDPRGMRLVFQALLILSAVLIPLGLWSHFLTFKPVNLIGLWNKLSVTVVFLALLKLTVTIIAKMSEEFLFRGIIQNFLHKMWGSEWASLLVTSVLFGLAHLNNGATSSHIYGWNWKYAGFATVAGVGYGKIFNITPTILYVTLLHILVDFLWGVLFK